MQIFDTNYQRAFIYPEEIGPDIDFRQRKFPILRRKRVNSISIVKRKYIQDRKKTIITRLKILFQESCRPATTSTRASCPLALRQLKVAFVSCFVFYLLFCCRKISFPRVFVWLCSLTVSTLVLDKYKMSNRHFLFLFVISVISWLFTSLTSVPLNNLHVCISLNIKWVPH